MLQIGKISQQILFTVDNSAGPGQRWKILLRKVKILAREFKKKRFLGLRQPANYCQVPVRTE
jgi:hypothetical protein